MPHSALQCGFGCTLVQQFDHCTQQRRQNQSGDKGLDRFSTVHINKKERPNGLSHYLRKLRLVLVWSVLEWIKRRFVIAVVRLHEESLELDLCILERI